jgi:hypothetical protein
MHLLFWFFIPLIFSMPTFFCFSLLSFVEVQCYQVSRIRDEEEATGRMQANRMRKCWNIIDPMKTQNKMLSWHSLLFQHGLQIQCSRNHPCLTSSSSRNPGLFQIFFGLIGLITFRGTGRDISDTAATGKKKIAWTDWFVKYSLRSNNSMVKLLSQPHSLCCGE